MSSTVSVRRIEFGAGRPKICIPLTDPDSDGLKRSIAAIRDTPFDFIEWRADFYHEIEDPAVRGRAMKLLRSALGDVPVLFTIRTDAEGGALNINTGAYTELLLSAVDSGLIDLVDAELSRGEAAMRTIVRAAHQRGVKVIASRHDFSSTPEKRAIVSSLCRMQELGADLVKFAVTPQSDRDVLTLLDATLTMKEEHDRTPVITMSMGRRGAVSRVCGGVFGSCVSFGTAGKASAPGQLPAGLLALFLENLS